MPRAERQAAHLESLDSGSGDAAAIRGVLALLRPVTAPEGIERARVCIERRKAFKRDHGVWA